MNNILVTGGAGFIGSHLADALLLRGYTVTVLDNLSLGRRENLQQALQNQAFRFVEGDILHEETLYGLFREQHFDMVFHLAANSDIARSHADPSIDLNLTFMTTFRVLEAMRLFGVKDLLFASTSAIYGQTGGVEVSEDFGPLFPASHYGAGKLASEGFIASYVENYGLRAFITRFPNVCGGRATHGVLHDFIDKLHNTPEELEVLGDGKQAKPYLHVRDLVDALLFVCDHAPDALNFYNLGVEGQTTVTDIAHMVIEAMGLHAHIRYTGGDRGWVGDVPRFAYNLNKIHRLGWKASMSSDQAVQAAIADILEQRI